MPFLTALDSRAKIKGSRDPLGLQPLWTRLGRQVVHNLTTVTASLREFTVHLLGMELVRRAAEHSSSTSIGLDSFFLKWEQLAAYSRYVINGEQQGIRGIDRVRERAASGRVRISADQRSQILSDQRVYGLWGLYTVASRSSGWLERERNALTPDAHKFVEMAYIAPLGRSAERIRDFLCGEREFEPRRRDHDLAKCIARLLGPSLTSDEQGFYYRHLLAAGGPGFPQELLWKKMRTKLNNESFSLAELRGIIGRCKSDDDADLRHRPERIEHIEAVIGPARILFGYLLARDGQRVSDVVKDIDGVWGKTFRHVDAEKVREALNSIECDDATRSRLQSLAASWRVDDYRAVLDRLLEQNAAVMHERGGAPWVRLRDGKLDVRFRADRNALPPRNELDRYWLNSYFLDSLKSIGRQIEGGSTNGR